MPDALFVTHARTLDELRAEVCSDLRRRLAALDLESKVEKRVGKLAAIGRAKMELESTLSFWQSVELRSSRKRESQP
jgi:hypothetical protein